LQKAYTPNVTENVGIKNRYCETPNRLNKSSPWSKAAPAHDPKTTNTNVWINVNDIPVSLVAAVLKKSAVSTVEMQIMEIENP
jgi:hypothetical protein